MTDDEINEAMAKDMHPIRTGEELADQLSLDDGTVSLAPRGHAKNQTQEQIEAKILAVFQATFSRYEKALRYIRSTGEPWSARIAAEALDPTYKPGDVQR